MSQRKYKNSFLNFSSWDWQFSFWYCCQDSAFQIVGEDAQPAQIGSGEGCFNRSATLLYYCSLYIRFNIWWQSYFNSLWQKKRKAMKEPRLLMVTEISNSTCTNTPHPNLTNPATTKVEIHLTERSAHTVSFARRPPSEEVVLVKLSRWRPGIRSPFCSCSSLALPRPSSCRRTSTNLLPRWIFD